MTEFASNTNGAMRESIGTKIDTSLVPYEIICAIAVSLEYGAKKYSDRNYEKGLSYKELCGSIERHNKAIMDNEIVDKDSGLPHEVMLAASIAMLVTCWSRETIIDDRPIPCLYKDGKGSVGETSKKFQKMLNEKTRN